VDGCVGLVVATGVVEDEVDIALSDRCFVSIARGEERGGRGGKERDVRRNLLPSRTGDSRDGPRWSSSPSGA